MTDMVDILLTTSYYLRYDPKQQRLMKPYPPLATLYAASVLRRAGYSVALFDAMFAPGEHAFDAALERHRPSVVVLYEDSFNWLNKMCLARMRSAALTMADRARSMLASFRKAWPTGPGPGGLESSPPGRMPRMSRRSTSSMSTR